ncbi:MAG: phospho-N-acetylmuramoyl-pentapeptide-transferase [bacterium]
MLQSFFLFKFLILTSAAFILALLWEPLLYRLLLKYKMGKSIRDAEAAPVMSQMHAHKSGTPVMGGLLVWVTALILALVCLAVYKIWPDSFIGRMNFLTQSQTLLPLGVLVASAIVGLVDDYLNVRRIGPKGGGLSVKHRLLTYSVIAAFGAWWFYSKLGWTIFHVPFMGSFDIGWLYIPVFFTVIVATSNSVNETDGLDGLSGGTLLIAFGAYAVIAALQGKYDLATFLGVLMGGLLAFLWFNIHPAKFFMGDTGAMSLGVTLGVVAMLTNTALLLPIIGFIFVLETLSVIIQTASKKLRGGRKVFISTPIHHHFEAIGWPETKIVMRAWVVALITAALGVVLVVADQAKL